VLAFSELAQENRHAIEVVDRQALPGHRRGRRAFAAAQNSALKVQMLRAVSRFEFDGSVEQTGQFSRAPKLGGGSTQKPVKLAGHVFDREFALFASRLLHVFDRVLMAPESECQQRTHAVNPLKLQAKPRAEKCKARAQEIRVDRVVEHL
jgi:hypothetical protein